MRERVARGLHGVGIDFVAVDLEGYRTGSHNEALPGARGEAS